MRHFNEFLPNVLLDDVTATKALIRSTTPSYSFFHKVQYREQKLRKTKAEKCWWCCIVIYRTPGSLYSLCFSLSFCWVFLATLLA